jgi:anti-sigma factor RsiW
MTHDEAVDLAAGYVLGALEPAEEAAVREHLATCDLPHPEFDELGSVVPALLELDESQLVEPPAGLRDRVMAAAAADLATGSSPAAPIAFPSAAQRTAREETRSRTSRLDWAIRIAAVLAIVALGAWGLSLQRQLNDAQAFDRAVASVVQAASQPGAKTVILAPAQGHQGSGIAAVNPDGSVVLAMHDLPASTGGDVYTAWVIVGSQPTSLGDFDVGANGTSGFTSGPASTPAGATIAVTLEPNAGNTAPKGPVVSAGVATAPPASS